MCVSGRVILQTPTIYWTLSGTHYGNYGIIVHVTQLRAPESKTVMCELFKMMTFQLLWLFGSQKHQSDLWPALVVCVCNISQMMYLSVLTYMMICFSRTQEAITDGLEIAVSPRSLHSELMCPICLDMLKNTMTTKECLHRFCADCIITALRSGWVCTSQ